MPELTLPLLEPYDLEDARSRRRLMDYLYRLTEQVRYALSHLELENFTPQSRQAVEQAAQTAAAAREETKKLSREVTESLLATATQVQADHTAALNAALEALESVYVKESAFVGSLGTLEQTLKSELRQTARAVELDFTDRLRTLTGEVEEAVQLAARFEFSAEGMTVNRIGQLVYLLLDNDAIRFRKGTQVLAELTRQGLSVPAVTADRLKAAQQAAVGRFLWRDEGALGFSLVRGNEEE